MGRLQLEVCRRNVFTIANVTDGLQESLSLEKGIWVGTLDTMRGRFLKYVTRCLERACGPRVLEVKSSPWRDLNERSLQQYSQHVRIGINSSVYQTGSTRWAAALGCPLDIDPLLPQ